MQSAEYRLRSERAVTLCLAIADCQAEDAAPILWAALDDFHKAGLPVSPLTSVMATATAWAECASEVELKAYALAAIRRVTPATREAFLIYMRGR
jgi:hypothetical protein